MLSYVSVPGPIVEIKKMGRRPAIKHGRKKAKTKVAGLCSKIFVDGKKAKCKAIKMGMNCTFTYLRPSTESKIIECKS